VPDRFSDLCLDPAIVGPWVCAEAGGTWVPGRGTAIGRLKDGKLIAGVLYEDFNGANVVCHIRGEPDWATREYLGVIYDYPFNQIGVRRITVPVCSTNKKCITLVTHMGFTLESELVGATRLGNMLLFRMFKEECKYLKGKYALH
jgi:RimJ/RimL family protein N-acetyltransferase